MSARDGARADDPATMIRVVRAMRAVAPWDSGRETMWQFQERQARAVLEAARDAS